MAPFTKKWKRIWLNRYGGATIWIMVYFIYPILSQKCKHLM